jgi:hypothetical protein
MMLDREWALEFADEWIEGWNSHDMDRILSHYSDGFRMSSPLIVARTGRIDGFIEGRDAVARYWAPSLDLDPTLKFALIDVLVGVDRLTLYYDNVGRRRVVETLTFNAELLAVEGCSQWSVLASR